VTFDFGKSCKSLTPPSPEIPPPKVRIPEKTPKILMDFEKVMTFSWSW